MAGCKCAGRAKKSPSMQRYKLENRRSINQDKAVKRHKYQAAKHQQHLNQRIADGKPQRGDARRDRRAAIASGNSSTVRTQREKWQKNNINILGDYYVNP